MTSDPFEKNRAAYDEIAGRYAERNAEMLPYLVDSANRLIDALRAAGNLHMHVLDLGCGAGRDSAWLEVRGLRMVGGDLSRGMLEEARKHIHSPLVQLDMRSLPFTGDIFAAVWCQAALLHLPKALAPAALLEAWRVLIPGGLLYVSVQRGETEGFETRPYEPQERYYAHYQTDEFVELVQSAGFVIAEQGEAEARRPWVWIRAKKI